MTAAEASAPVYFKQPIRWMRYYAHNRPHLFFAVMLGAMGPVFLLGVGPLRRKYLYPDHTPLPQSYPVPKAPRNKDLKGFDDE
ncbi:hypothetical protein DASC09_042350 [Saccharomycopsis crataegensis]|uniref:NADH-ubiquinone oxidoreductase 9.5 kDa subunit n=1 Tax=Saccharomycopsis crataegensis TaxID=43959 RepID=A0AAV5QPQ2_9ASCO|nr:hypothetical protein DASC09_042350 [Saccharomycopsis crataegensis]